MVWRVLAEGVAPSDPLELINYGILGLILLMLLTGWLWAKPAVEDIQKRHAEERKLWEDRILPEMQRLSRNLERNNNLMRQLLQSRGLKAEEEIDS